jgi:hypothetical protein
MPAENEAGVCGGSFFNRKLGAEVFGLNAMRVSAFFLNGRVEGTESGSSLGLTTAVQDADADLVVF